MNDENMNDTYIEDAMKAENRKKKKISPEPSSDNGSEFYWTHGEPSKLMTQINNHILTEQHDHLMEKVVERGNMTKALKRVESNKGSAGVDKMQAEELLPSLRKNWDRIEEELLKGTYEPSPVRRVSIPKQDGGARELGIPTVLDRLIQQAIHQVLTPIFEPTFSEFSYGFRPGKSQHQALRKTQGYIQSGKRIVVDIDLEKFFDRVNHDILMTKVAKHVTDKRILKVIRKFLQAGVMLGGCFVKSEEGTPQGGPISPLLSNIMLNELDHELTRRGHSFARYADDCNIYVGSLRAGQRVYASVAKFLQQRLKLKINEQKSAVDLPERRKFLGFSFLRSRTQEIVLRIAPQAITKFKDKIREITKSTWSISMEDRIKRLNVYVVGWSGYFCIAQTRTVFRDLDAWIRRRLRLCLLEQWKEGKTKLAKLIALGLGKGRAAQIAHSRKGSWRLSRSPQISDALDNPYWRAQGLVSLVDRNAKMLTPASA
jgi:group II intron reverse transcriptase/maturase